MATTSRTEAGKNGSKWVAFWGMYPMSVPVGNSSSGRPRITTRPAVGFGSDPG